MIEIILNDLWHVMHLLLVCTVITATVLINILMALRLGYFFKSYRDHIGAFKKEELKKKEDLDEPTRRTLYRRAKNRGDKEGMKTYAPKFRRNNPREK